MKKNGLTLLTGTITGLIIVVLCIIVYIAFFSKASGISSDPIVAQCQQSAALAGVVRIPGVDKKIFDFNCPISKKTITERDVSLKVSASKLEGLGYTDSKRYLLDQAMWQQIAECYQKVNYGKFPIFDRNSVDNEDATYCVVCSKVSFDGDYFEEASNFNPGPDATPFVNKFNIRGLFKPLAQVLEERKDVVGTTRSNYNVYKDQAVVYYRTQVRSVDKLIGKFEPLTACSETLCELKQGLFTPSLEQLKETLLGMKKLVNTADENYVISDADGVIVINYESQGSLDGFCTELGNEAYIDE